MTDKLLERVGALLAKAESTDSEHEAQALVAKAQQLATLHAVDLATARARTARRQRRLTPTQRKVAMGRRSEPGRRHRVRLFVAVAQPNDVRVDVARDATYVLAFGFATDLDVVEALFASLATQMVASANAAIRRGEHRKEVYWSESAGTWRSDARVFRSAFNHGFLTTVAQRLAEARAQALAVGDDDGQGAGASTGALVLARKADEVEAYHRATSQARGLWRDQGRTVAWSVVGHASGQASGRTARLTGQRALPGARGALESDAC